MPKAEYSLKKAKIQDKKKPHPCWCQLESIVCWNSM